MVSAGLEPTPDTTILTARPRGLGDIVRHGYQHENDDDDNDDDDDIMTEKVKVI